MEWRDINATSAVLKRRSMMQAMRAAATIACPSVLAVRRRRVSAIAVDEEDDIYCTASSMGGIFDVWRWVVCISQR